MSSVPWFNDPALVSTNFGTKQAQQEPHDTDQKVPSDTLQSEERLGDRLNRKLDSFMTYICFPEEQMDYDCFPEKLRMDQTTVDNVDADTSPIVGFVKKESQDEKLGISIKKHLRFEGIYIHKIDSTSKLKLTDLAPEMKIISINDEPCPPTVIETVAVLKLAKDTIKIVAKPTERGNNLIIDDATRESAPRDQQDSALPTTSTTNTVSFTDYLRDMHESVTWAYTQYEESITNMSVNGVLEAMTGLEAFSEEDVCIQKESQKEKLGIALMQAKASNDIYVNHVSDGSKFAAAGLKPGVKIIKINGQACPASLQDTVEIMNGAPRGSLGVTVIADDQFCYELDETLIWDGKPMANKVTVRIEKRKDEPIGMLLRRYDGKEGIFVRMISEDGKVAGTSLKPHMKVLLINNQRCPQEMDDCTELITNIEGELKIVAISCIPQELMQAVDA